MAMAAVEPSQAIPRDSAEAADHIGRFTSEIVREALTVRALVDTLRGAKKFIEQAAREYAERFLFELIQNAYDAQPAGSAGRVLVAFDATEGEFGCAYVANTGTPFTADNFRAICEIAQSSKQPGEGIGNKGVGFKSAPGVSLDLLSPTRSPRPASPAPSPRRAAPRPGEGDVRDQVVAPGYLTFA